MGHFIQKGFDCHQMQPDEIFCNSLNIYMIDFLKFRIYELI